MKHLLSFLLLLTLSLPGWAQIETPVSDTMGMAIDDNVRVFKDSRLDILSQRPPLMAKLADEQKDKKEITNYKPIVSNDGKKKVTGSIYTKKGFRVVIFSGPDRNLAMQAKNAFTRAFPGIPSYVSYNVPSYKIKVGNFESRGEASEFIRRVNRAFPTSFIVPDIVTIKNINVTY